MRVLVATSETQGTRGDDFSWTVDGELVRLPLSVCDCADCGCDRSFAGLASHRATTTARVAERPELDWDTYARLLLDDAAASGLPLDDDVRELLAEERAVLLAVARSFPIGTVVEHRDGEVRARQASPSPP